MDNNYNYNTGLNNQGGSNPPQYSNPYAYQNFCFIKYVTCMGVKWKVESVDASNPPRLTLQASTRYIGPDDVDE